MEGQMIENTRRLTLWHHEFDFQKLHFTGLVGEIFMLTVGCR
jgi:hypothetical protein